MAMTAAGSIEAELRGSVAVANVAAAQLAESCEALRRKLADVEAAKAAAEERVSRICETTLTHEHFH
jgi:hypothetical protein